MTFTFQRETCTQCTHTTLKILLKELFALLVSFPTYVCKRMSLKSRFFFFSLSFTWGKTRTIIYPSIHDKDGGALWRPKKAAEKKRRNPRNISSLCPNLNFMTPKLTHEISFIFRGKCDAEFYVLLGCRLTEKMGFSFLASSTWKFPLISSFLNSRESR